VHSFEAGRYIIIDIEEKVRCKCRITLYSCEEGRNIIVHELKVAVTIQRNTVTLRLMIKVHQVKCLSLLT